MAVEVWVGVSVIVGVKVTVGVRVWVAVCVGGGVSEEDRVIVGESLGRIVVTRVVEVTFDDNVVHPLAKLTKTITIKNNKWILCIKILCCANWIT